MEEREEFSLIISEKDREIQRLKSELEKHKVKLDLDTLTTNNDPYSLKQEVQDLNIMLEEVEQERDEAKNYIKQLEEELNNTKEILKNNQMNLIDPLQNRILELESIVEEKEGDIKKRYKRKLRKYKREIEIERSINEKLKEKLSKHQTKFREESGPGLLYHIIIMYISSNYLIVSGEHRVHFNTNVCSRFCCTPLPFQAYGYPLLLLYLGGLGFHPSLSTGVCAIAAVY